MLFPMTFEPERIINDFQGGMISTVKEEASFSICFEIFFLIILSIISGYNAALHCRAQQSHLSIRALIELLITEETGVRMKHFQWLNGKTKTIKKSIRDGVVEIKQYIIEFNQKFKNNEIQLDECLLSLASLVGVKYDRWRK